MSLVDFMSKKVQDFSGETERRELVQNLKNTYHEHRQRLHVIIEKINEKVSKFNVKIQQINKFREEKVFQNINCLGEFLKCFGNLDLPAQFSAESEKDSIKLPQKKFEILSDYIEEIDWSKSDVFQKTFCKTLIGMKFETRKMNISMHENLNRFRLEAMHSEKIAELKVKSIETDIQIANCYQDNIKRIDTMISKKIVPELELIEAFMYAETIKNNIIIDKNDESFCSNNDITLLKGSIYDKHYRFIKNTFMFYVISKKIYNTPILTRLLNDSLTDTDVEEILKEQQVLEVQESAVIDQMVRR